MPWVSGHVLTEEGFREGSIEFDNDNIIDISGKRAEDPIAKGLIIPSFVNAHTHVGDSFIRQEISGTIEEVVAPPDGLKHRLLEKASDEDILDGMTRTIEEMVETGTSHFVDFREGGVKGASLLYKAALGKPINPILYGRPPKMEYDRQEIESLLNVVDGLGISSALDWDTSTLEKLRGDARRLGKGFALHASERIREDIDTILDLKPDFIVHMLEASDADFERCSDADVPIVVCPRSNAFFGKFPDFGRMLKTGVRIMIGTDNAMLNSSSMFDEIEFIYRMTRQVPNLTSGSILGMVLESRKVLKGQQSLSLETGQPPDFLVLHWHGGNPENHIVARASEKDVSLIARNGRIWTREKGRLKEETKWQRRDQRS